MPNPAHFPGTKSPFRSMEVSLYKQVFLQSIRKKLLISAIASVGTGRYSSHIWQLLLSSCNALSRFRYCCSPCCCAAALWCGTKL